MKKYLFFIPIVIGISLCLFVNEINAQVRATPDRLGVGTESPDEKLEVEGNNVATRIGVTTTTAHNATFRAKTPNSDFGWYAGGNANVFQLYDFNANLDRMTIASNGNVGIGIVPAYKLDVAGRGRFDDILRVGQGVNSPVQGQGTHIGWNRVSGSGRAFFASQKGQGNGGFEFITYNLDNTIDNISMTILGNGDVGIGTTSPDAKLHTTTNQSTTGFFENNASAVISTYAIQGHNLAGIGSAGNKYGVEGYATGTGTKFGVYGRTGASISGIQYGVYGTTSASLFTRYAGYFNGNLAYTGTLTDVSDEQFKEKIRGADNMLDKVLQLSAKTYFFKKDKTYQGFNFSEGKQFGFIAQELQQVFPELVTKNVHTYQNEVTQKSQQVEYLGINYVHLIPVLTKAIQELADQVNGQKNIIEEKDDKIVALEKRMEELEQMMQTVMEQRGEENSSIQQGTLNKKAFLKQNQPNPFSENTSIDYFIPDSAKRAVLQVFTLEGRMIEQFELDIQASTITLNNASLPAGNYIYHLVVDGIQVDSKQMLLTK